MPSLLCTQDIFGHVSPQLTGDAIAQWCLHGKHKPQPGDRFYAFSIAHQDWIGAGSLYREDGDTLALLEEGSFHNFARFERDARGLILVFLTGGILR